MAAEEDTPAPPPQDEQSGSRLTDQERGAVAVTASVVGLVSGVSAFVSTYVGSGLALFVVSALVAAVALTVTVVAMRLWRLRQRRVTLSVSVIAVVVVALVAVGAVGAAVGPGLGVSARPGPTPSQPTGQSATSSALPTPTLVNSAPIAGLSPPPPSPIAACWVFTDAVKALSTSLRAVQPALEANADDKPIAVKPGFSKAAGDTEDAIRVAKDSFAAYGSAKLQIPTNEFVSHAEFLELLDEIERILTSLQTKIPAGNGDPDDYTALPDRAGRLGSLATRVLPSQCPR